MDTEKEVRPKRYELLPLDGEKAVPIRKKRVLIGRSQACDIVFSGSGVTAIHAVLEITPNHCRIYDMNSTNGTYVNGERVLSEEIKVGDKIKLGRREFQFKELNLEEIVPPPLEILEPIKKELPEAPEMSKSETIQKDKILSEENPSLRVSYPLAKDPKAEFSEYIFEDADTLFPIFDYDIQSQSVEVIILYKNKIYSIDYLPIKTGQVHHLVGRLPKNSDIGYSLFDQKEKIPFVEFKDKGIFVSSPKGYDVFSLNSEKENTKTNFLLADDDIIRFSSGEHQIYVRGSEAPPYVEPAPILRRDPLFLKSLIITFLFVLTMLISLSLWEIDEELEKEKIPERIATILPKKIKPKEPANKEKVPLVKNANKVPSKGSEVKPKRPSDKNERVVKAKNPGNKKDGVKKPAKKAPPKKGPKNKVKVRVVRPTSGSKSKALKTKKTKVSKTNKAKKGRQDVYKAADFAPTLNNLMARSGKSKNVAVVDSSVIGGGKLIEGDGGESYELKDAKVSDQLGSIDGLKNGNIDGGRGGADIVGKRTTYISSGPAQTRIIMGGLDPDIIKKILKDHMPQFNYCYQKELDLTNKTFNGVIKLNFIIGASGRVSKAGIRKSKKIAPPKVANCVLGVLRGIKFPKPPGGGIVEIDQGLNLKSKRR